MKLPNDLDYLMQPVRRGMCLYESLKSGALDLCDIALMNEACEAADENQRRANAAATRK